MNYINFVVLDHRVERQPFKRNFTDCFCKGGGVSPQNPQLNFWQNKLSQRGEGGKPQFRDKILQENVFLLKNIF